MSSQRNDCARSFAPTAKTGALSSGANARWYGAGGDRSAGRLDSPRNIAARQATIDRRALVVAVCAGFSGFAGRANSATGAPGRWNVKDFGAVGDGETDDQAAFESAVKAAGATGGSVYAPAGRYLLGRGGLLLEHVELLGDGGRDATMPYGVSGTVLITRQQQNPVILLGRGARLTNLAFYYPEQLGQQVRAERYPELAGEPLHFPATIKSHHAKGGVSACIVDRCTFVNSSVAIELGEEGKAVGRITIEDCEACVSDTFLKVVNAQGLIQVRNTFASLGVFQGVAIVGDQRFGKWAQRNAKFIELRECHGIQVSGGIVYGFRYGIHARTGKFSNSVISSLAFDSTPEPFVIEEAVVANNIVVTGCTFYASDRYAKAPTGPAFNLAPAPGSGTVLIANCAFQYALGPAIVVRMNGEGAGFSVSMAELSFENWCMAARDVRDAPAVLVDARGATVMMRGSRISARQGKRQGLFVENAEKVLVSDSVFVGCESAITVRRSEYFMLKGSIVTETRSPVSVQAKARKSAISDNIVDRQLLALEDVDTHLRK